MQFSDHMNKFTTFYESGQKPPHPFHIEEYDVTSTNTNMDVNHIYIVVVVAATAGIGCCTRLGIMQYEADDRRKDILARILFYPSRTE